MEGQALVSLEHVSHSFDDGRILALRDVNLTIRESESVAIVGASGSGKSTLILLMCGIRVPVKGRVLWRGTAVTKSEQWTALRRTEIGIVFQEFNLFPTLTARENVEVAMFGTGPGRHERGRRADDALAVVGLSKRATHLPHELSGGERQRIAIARSIINNPRLILADEPTGNLDSVNAKAILDLLFELRKARGATLVMVSHEPSYARRCARQIKIKDGTVYEGAEDQPIRKAV
jgi:putative ABC transport system ATP-binding protein